MPPYKSSTGLPTPAQQANDALEFAAERKVMESKETQQAVQAEKKSMAKAIAGMKGDNTEGGVGGQGTEIKMSLSSGRNKKGRR